MAVKLSGRQADATGPQAKQWAVGCSPGLGVAELSGQAGHRLGDSI